MVDPSGRKRPFSPSQDEPAMKKKCEAAVVQAKEPVFKPIELGMILNSKYGNYEVGAEIGDGGFGKIFNATDISTGKQFALKVVMNRTPKQLRRNRLEVNILMKTRSSEFLLGLETAFIHKREQMCILMDKLDIDLFDYTTIILDNQPMKITVVRKILKQVLLGVSALHSMGIVHCDLKLENLMLVNRKCPKNPYRVKIIDFGNFNSTQKIRSRTGLKLHNFQYRAPEILFGLPASEKIDIWALGVLAMEMYAGFQLFMGNTEWQTIVQYEKIFELPDDVRQGLSCAVYLKERKDKYGNSRLTVKSKAECEALEIPTGDYEAVSNYKYRGMKKLVEYGYNNRVRGMARSVDHQFVEAVESLLRVNEYERASAVEALQCQFFYDPKEVICID